MKTKFERLSLLPPYVFAEINDLKAKERLKGRDVIDLGMGNPDNSTPKHIVDKLIETIKNGKTHRYSVSKGILGLRKAHSNYYKRRFGVKLNFEDEVVVTLGSKEVWLTWPLQLLLGRYYISSNPSYQFILVLIAGAIVKQIKWQKKSCF